MEKCGGFDPPRLDIVIYDKTVPERTFREHKAFINVLGADYINAKTGDFFSLADDYYGFVPLGNDSYALKPLPPVFAGTDIFYLTDAYGVYTKEFYGRNPRGERSQKIYGALTVEDVERVHESLEAGALFIAEFNTFASPTSSKAEEMISKILGVNWTGWTGRYFTNLVKGGEVPDWAVENYEKAYKKNWVFAGPGYILVKNDFVTVLREPEDILPDGCWFSPTEFGTKIFPELSDASYLYWFDILEPDTGAVTLADFSLKVTAEGAKVIAPLGIPSVFPAVILNEADSHTSFYFAGDFADRDDRFVLLRSDKDIRFFKKVYTPLLKGILERVVFWRGKPRPVRFTKG